MNSTWVVRELKKEASIRLAGLGVFRKRKLAARVGRNQATGEQISIPARTRLPFTSAKLPKESVLGVSAMAAKKEASLEAEDHRESQQKIAGPNASGRLAFGENCECRALSLNRQFGS